MKKSLILITLLILLNLLYSPAYAVNIVRFGPEYFPQYSAGRPLAFADIYVGEQDTDPEVVGNQKQLYIQEEDGTFTAVSQPISTGAGGVPLYSGDPVTLYVSGTYSIKVLSSGGSQIYYNPNVIPRYEPAFDLVDKLSDYDDLADAVSSIGATPTELWIDTDSVMDENVTSIPTTLKFKFIEGNIITTTGYTLGLSGSPQDHIIALLGQQIFDGTGTVTFGEKGTVYPDWWETNTTPGTTDMTDAIDYALATDCNVMLLGTTYASTGDHTIDTNGQKFVGAGPRQTTLKKLSGTNTLLTTGGIFVEVSNMTIDANNLGGTTLAIGGAYHVIEHLDIKNQATNYAVTVTNCSGLRVNDIIVTLSHGGIDIDGDWVGGGNINNKFTNVTLDGSSAGDYMLKMDFVDKITFYGLALDDAPSAYGFIYMGDYVYNADFFGTSMEVASALTSAPAINVSASGCNAINFFGGRFTSTSTAASYPLILLTNAQQVLFDGIWFNVTGTHEEIILVAGADGVSVENCWMTITNAHDFIASSTLVYDIKVENVKYYGGTAPTMTFTDARDVVVTNTNLNVAFGGTVNRATLTGVSGDINSANMGEYSLYLINCTGTVTDSGNIANEIRRGKMIFPWGTLTNDGTPSVSGGPAWWMTGGTTTITDFDNGVPGEMIFVYCLHSLTFDTTTAQDDDHNLFGSSVNISASPSDILIWVCELDGVTWSLVNNLASADDNN